MHSVIRSLLVVKTDGTVTLADPMVGGRQTDRPWGESLIMES